MWMQFFTVCDWLCNLIPGRVRRERTRATKLYDWRKKYNALRAAFPDMPFKHVKMIKGGWNIGFIVDRKYVFKIRKFFDEKMTPERVLREKRITDAFANISPLRIPKIEIIDTDGFTFYKYDFIPGKNLTTFSQRVINQNTWKWGRQIAEFINAVHNAHPTEIDDLRVSDGDGWNHNDICNNLIVDPKTMDIVGLIDWEYANWDVLDKEFRNTIRFSKKMQRSEINIAIQLSYYVMNKRNCPQCAPCDAADASDKKKPAADKATTEKRPTKKRVTKKSA